MEAVPRTFICPITQTLMDDPVIDKDGNSYERSAIVAWVSARGNSPITRAPLTLDELYPNRSLLDAINDYLASLPPATAAQLRPGFAPTPSSVFESLTTTSVAPPPPALPQLTLEITSTQTPSSDQHTILASILSSESVERVPSDIVCVVDVSGSMGDLATTAGIEAETSRLSLLDITKHAMKTIISTLGDKDRLAIVSFSDIAGVKCPLTRMDAAGRVQATNVVNNLHAGGSTNLWDGLLKGLDLLKARSSDVTMWGGAAADARNAALMLLTDGCPSVEPPRGHLPMLKRYRDSNGGKYPCTISTFGFGYSLDSKLLVEMASEGGGMYSFIPDAGFVGTAFVHALANTLATVARDVVLKLEPEEGTAESALVGFPADSRFSVSWGYELQLSSVQAGQSISNAIQLNAGSARSDALLSATLVYRPSGSVSVFTIAAVGPVSASFTEQERAEKDANIQSNVFRLQFVKLVSAACTAAARCYAHNNILTDANVQQCVAEIDAMLSNAKRWLETAPICPARKRVVGLVADLEGQVREAIGRPDYFAKWGRHYLPSLLRAHELQQCNNFKDPGLQEYGGALFQSIRDVADDIFSNLPPPVSPVPPATWQSSASRIGGQAQGRAAPISMASFNSRNTPCVHGDSVMLLLTGATIRAKDVRKGVFLASGKVLCVIETLCPDGQAELVTLPSGLRITPWHPVLHDGIWAFPCTLGRARRTPCRAVYSFVVECVTTTDTLATYSQHAIIDGMRVATMAHGIEADPVASHPFFGTTAAIAALSMCKGWTSGTVTFLPNCLLRDQSGLVVGFDLGLEVDARSRSSSQTRPGVDVEGDFITGYGGMGMLIEPVHAR